MYTTRCWSSDKIWGDVHIQGQKPLDFAYNKNPALYLLGYRLQSRPTDYKLEHVERVSDGRNILFVNSFRNKFDAN